MRAKFKLFFYRLYQLFRIFLRRHFLRRHLLFNKLLRLVSWLLLLNISILFYANFVNIVDNKSGPLLFFFYVILYILSGVSTYTVLSSFNYIVSIVYLIFLFSVTGLILMFCGINFVGLTLIAVYVGGVLLLFLSVIKFLGFRAGDSMYFSDFYSGLFRGLVEVSKLLVFLLIMSLLFYLVFNTGSYFFNIILSK